MEEFNIAMLYCEYQQMVDNLVFMAMATVIAIDMSTGLIAAWVRRDLDSGIGFRGTAKHWATLMVIIVVFPYLTLFDVEAYVYPVFFTYTIQNIISITENLGDIGVNLPKGLMEKLERLKDQPEEKSD